MAAMAIFAIFITEEADVDVDIGIINVNEPTITGGDHVELIIGQLDWGFDKLVSHLFLQDLGDSCEELQSSSSLLLAPPPQTEPIKASLAEPCEGQNRVFSE
jgi:hypothetical protein